MYIQVTQLFDNKDGRCSIGTGKFILNIIINQKFYLEKYKASVPVSVSIVFCSSGCVKILTGNKYKYEDTKCA